MCEGRGPGRRASHTWRGGACSRGSASRTVRSETRFPRTLGAVGTVLTCLHTHATEQAYTQWLEAGRQTGSRPLHSTYILSKRRSQSSSSLSSSIRASGSWADEGDRMYAFRQPSPHGIRPHIPTLLARPPPQASTSPMPTPYSRRSQRWPSCRSVLQSQRAPWPPTVTGVESGDRWTQSRPRASSNAISHHLSPSLAKTGRLAPKRSSRLLLPSASPMVNNNLPQRIPPCERKKARAHVLWLDTYRCSPTVHLASGNLLPPLALVAAVPTAR